MKISRGLKRFLFAGVAALVIDKLAVGYVFQHAPMDSVSKGITSSQMYEASNADEFKEVRFEGSDDEKALQYLKLAHATTLRYLDIGFYPSGDLENVIQQGRGDCTEAASWTIGHYLRFTKEQGEEKLGEKVRMAFGFVRTPDNLLPGPHGWLEIQQDGEWVPYETSADPIQRNDSIDPKSLDELLPSSTFMDNGKLKYLRKTTAQVGYDGGIRRKRDWKGLLTEEGGFTGLVLFHMTYNPR